VEALLTDTQCFSQSVPLWETHVAIRDGPQKNEERTNLALSFNKITGLTRRSILKAIPGLEIAPDTVTNVTNISSLATKIRQKFWFSHHNGD